ncbi:MAG: hypothetical protein U9R15_04510 [Chloroflexota bacterium]|nr:hypothetical protein [Chloroflexota bacterium]
MENMTKYMYLNNFNNGNTIDWTTLRCLEAGHLLQSWVSKRLDARLIRLHNLYHKKEDPIKTKDEHFLSTAEFLEIKQKKSDERLETVISGFYDPKSKTIGLNIDNLK